MYLRQLTNGNWRVEVERHGQRHSHVTTTKRAAQAWGHAKEVELGAVKRGGGKTFGQAAQDYERTVSANKRGADWEAKRLISFVEHFGERTPLASISSADIGAWRNLRLETVSGSTVLREANLLRNLFTVAVDEWKVLDTNPFKGVRMPEANPPRHQMWTWPLIRRVLRSDRAGKTGETVRAFRIALHTGLRLSEVLAGRFDPSRRVIELERTKTGGRVLVPVPRRALKLLPDTFTVEANEASALFSRLLSELLIEDLTFHDARAFALTMLSRRMDVMTLARISRHKNLKTLMEHYYRESSEDIARRI